VRTKRLLPAAAAALAAYGANIAGDALGRFEIRLSPERKTQQAIHRLTFGARPGETEEVQKLGVEKWIELQLHPDRIAENPVLEDRLKPLETIRMESADVLMRYFPQTQPGMSMMRPVSISNLLTPDERRKIYNGNAEQRKVAIMALDAGKRTQVLAMVPDDVVEGLPELQKERDAARKQQQEERQAEMRRLRPPLADVLDQSQMQIALFGSAERQSALFATLDSTKLEQVAAALPPDALAGRPELRRMGAMARFPQQLVVADLRNFTGPSTPTGNCRRCSPTSGSTISTCSKARVSRTAYCWRVMSATPSGPTF
jgi:Protein of unknown function (DUF1800)